MGSGRHVGPWTWMLCLVEQRGLKERREEKRRGPGPDGRRNADVRRGAGKADQGGVARNTRKPGRGQRRSRPGHALQGADGRSSASDAVERLERFPSASSPRSGGREFPGELSAWTSPKPPYPSPMSYPTSCAPWLSLSHRKPPWNTVPGVQAWGDPCLREECRAHSPRLLPLRQPGTGSTWRQRERKRPLSRPDRKKEPSASTGTKSGPHLRLSW